MVGLRLIALLSLAACAGASPTPDEPPPSILGTFVDDYGVRHQITATEWRQGSDTVYRIVRWQRDHLIARNAPTNPSDANLWTRIDWLELDDPSYPWAFCLSAYKAPTRAAAASTEIADRATPRSGCNGFPFSRMRRLTAN